MKNTILLFICSVFFSTLAIGQEVHEEVLSNWNQPVTPSVITGYEGEDAVVVFNRQYKSFFLTLVSNVFKVIPVESSHRRIKINSQKGVENFVTVYIPLPEDATEEMLIVEMKGRTIKKNGSIIPVKSDFIKETTLPANAPFLYGYKGKVKQFVFQNIEIGDEVEYYYTVTYKYGFIAAQLYSYKNIQLNTPNATLEHKTVIYIDKTMKFYQYSRNCSNTFFETTVNGKAAYELLVKNPTVNKKELFDNDNYSAGTVFYSVFYGSLKRAETWEEYIKELSQKVSKRELITDELSIQELSKNAKSITDINAKVKMVFDLLTEPLIKDTLKLLKMLDFQVDYYDAQQHVLLLKRMGVSSNIIFLKDKRDGEIDKNAIFDQFDDIMIEYISEDGKRHYMPIYKPHALIDDIDYQFQNTLALSVNGENNKVEFFKMPSNSSKNIIETKYDIGFGGKKGKIYNTKITKSVTARGSYKQDDRYLFLRQFNDASYKEYSKNITGNCKQNFEKVVINSIKLESISAESLKWNTTFDCEISGGQAEESFNLNLGELVEESFKINYTDKIQRTETAYLNFPFTRKNTYVVTLPDGFFVKENNFLTNDLKNSIGNFTSSYKIINLNTIEIQYTFNIAKEVINAVEWNDFVSLYDKAYAFKSQKVVGLRK